MDARRGAGHPRPGHDARKEPKMSEATDLVRRYLATWNESDPERRLASVEALWADEGGYVDPLAAVTGHAAISALIGMVQREAPGHVFRLLDRIDAHHNVARFCWELVPA